MLNGIRTKLVSQIIVLIEKTTFDRKIRKLYTNLNTSIFDESSNVVIIDVGANRGQSIKNFQNAFKKSKIIAFEANPKLARYLKEKYKQVSVFAFAVSGKVGTMTFYVSKLDLTSSLIIPNLDSRRYKLKSILIGKKSDFKEISVESTTLDKFCDENSLDSINLLKIDVEGAETMVLEGASNLLSSGRIDCVQVEIHKTDLRLDTSEKIARILNSHHYKKAYSVPHLIGNFEDAIFLRSDLY